MPAGRPWQSPRSAAYATTIDLSAETDGTFWARTGDANDSLIGGAGNDTLFGSEGADTLFGGAGNDLFDDEIGKWDGDVIKDLAVGDSIRVVDADLSALNGTTVGTTVDLGSGQSIILSGLTGSYTWNATYSYDGGVGGWHSMLSLTAVTNSGGGGGGGDSTATTSSGTMSSGTTSSGTTSSGSTSGDPGSAGTALSQGIASSSMTDTDKADAQAALNDFIAGLPNGGSVTFATQVLTSPDGQPTTISLTGSGSDIEAMIIDVSALPPGSVIDLNGIEFAVIIGQVSVTGGGGSNIVVGDGSRQFIVLGAEDDTLAGGGGADTIGSAGGADSLSGGADGNDYVVGDDGEDVACGGNGADRVLAGANADVICGNRGQDVLWGEDGQDMLFGGQDGDRLNGGSGCDYLSGDDGADTLTGGAGRDRFIYAGPSEGGDVITDFDSGSDALVLWSSGFGGLAAGTLDGRAFALAGAETADTRFVFASATGVLSYDADGAGGLAATEIALLINGRTITGDDIVLVE